MRIVRTTMDQAHLKAVLVRVMIAGTASCCRRPPTRRWCPPTSAGRPTRSRAAPPALSSRRGYTYGLGIIISGDWLLQNPLFAGYAATEAYLPAQKIAVAVAVTYDVAAFDGQGNYDNVAQSLFRKIGAELAPTDAPPVPGPK